MYIFRKNSLVFALFLITIICFQAISFSSKPSQILITLNKPTMIINNTTYDIDPGRGTMPIIKKSRFLLPIAPLIKRLGGNVGWEDAEKKVIVNFNQRTIEMFIGKNTLISTVNGVQTTLTMDIEPTIENSRTFLPIRFLTEQLGMEVTWHDDTKTVEILSQ